jgi:hypothetical protein
MHMKGKDVLLICLVIADGFSAYFYSVKQISETSASLMALLTVLYVIYYLLVAKGLGTKRFEFERKLEELERQHKARTWKKAEYEASKKEIERKMKEAEYRYMKRKIDERTFHELVKDYNKELVALEARKKAE